MEVDAPSEGNQLDAAAAARLSRQAARLLPGEAVSGAGWTVTVPGAPSAAGAAVLLDASLNRLLSAQLEAGPTSSVLDDDVKIVLVEPTEHAVTDVLPGEVLEVGASELSEVWKAAEAASGVTYGAESAARLAASLQPLGREQLGAPNMVISVATAADESPPRHVLTLPRGDVEEWLRARCVATWYAEGAQLKTDRLEAERRAEEEAQRAAEEAAAREAARAASEAAATSLRNKRLTRWERANQKILQKAENERRSKRSVFEVAIEQMAHRAAEAQGIDIEAVLADPSESDAGEVSAEGAREEDAAKAETSGAGSDDVSTLNGVGPARATKLRTAGFATVGALAVFDIEGLSAVAKDHKLPLTSLARWRAEARERCALDSLEDGVPSS